LRRILFPILIFALAALSPSCSKRTRTVVPEPALVAPAADTPADGLRALEWSWNNRVCEPLYGLFTDDYVFAFAPGDSAGNAYRDVQWTREDELAASCNLFANATEIDLWLDKTLYDLPDDRPGKDPRVHRSIRTAVTLTVNIQIGGDPRLEEVRGFAKFYLVRGDSAAIPDDQLQQGVGPDSTRWWIQRWEDETLPAGSRANPAMNRTWGALKVLFR